jgi:DNA-directed RNA polymerase subunit M/transcription elongation factor TFIIS
VSKYIRLAEEGLVSKLECPMDQGLLYPNQTNENIVYLYCISCNYKKDIGLSFYNQIVKAVDKFGKNDQK